MSEVLKENKRKHQGNTRSNNFHFWKHKTKQYIQTWELTAAWGEVGDESFCLLLALMTPLVPIKVLHYSPYSHLLQGQVCPLIHPVNHKHIQVILHVLYSRKETKIDTKIDSVYSARTALLVLAANTGQSDALKSDRQALKCWCIAEIRVRAKQKTEGDWNRFHLTPFSNKFIKQREFIRTLTLLRIDN